MNSPDEHLRKADNLSEGLADAQDDPFFKLSRGFISECKGDYIARRQAPPFGCSRCTTRCATTSVLPEPAHAMSCKFAVGNPIASA